MQNARLAESAFEQLMQMHQRHSKSRYQSAVALIAKIDKKMCQRQALEQIIYAAIANMNEERSILSQQQQVQQRQQEEEYLKQRQEAAKFMTQTATPKSE